VPIASLQCCQTRGNALLPSRLVDAESELRDLDCGVGERQAVCDCELCGHCVLSCADVCSWYFKELEDVVAAPSQGSTGSSGVVISSH
jgi:hypothetical protein